MRCVFLPSVSYSKHHSLPKPLVTSSRFAGGGEVTVAVMGPHWAHSEIWIDYRYCTLIAGWMIMNDKHIAYFLLHWEEGVLQVLSIYQLNKWIVDEDDDETLLNLIILILTDWRLKMFLIPDSTITSYYVRLGCQTVQPKNIAWSCIFHLLVGTHGIRISIQWI